LAWTPKGKGRVCQFVIATYAVYEQLMRLAPGWIAEDHLPLGQLVEAQNRLLAADPMALASIVVPYTADEP
jgi:hypothetical protein